MQPPAESLDEKCGSCHKYLSCFPVYIDKNKLPLCGRCLEYISEETTLIRATVYESFAKHFKFPCIYSGEGCLENLFPFDVPNHEKNCPYRIISCPLDCMWQGIVNDLLPHFEELHQDSILKSEFEMDFSNSYELYNLVEYNDELFSFKRKFDFSEGVLECALLCYKMLDPVTCYKYEINIENGLRNLSLKFPPKSAENFQSENTTQISIEQVKNKLDDPSVIIGTLRIFTEEEDMPPEKIDNKKTKELINYDMLSELECPVCFDYIIPPIYQCVTGHSICGECKDRVSECPTCKEEIRNTQNFTLEKMAYFLTYPCKFTEFGCDFTSKPGKIREHQKFCLHGPHTCPLKDYEDCKWKDSAKDIYKHILQKHHDNLLEIDLVSLFIDGNYFAGEDFACYVMKFANRLFKLHYLYKRDVFYWAMQLIGPPEDSKKYKFEIDIVDNTNSGQRMFLRSFCAPLTEKNQSFQNEGTYIFINVNQIRSFLTDILTYRARIVVV